MIAGWECQGCFSRYMIQKGSIGSLVKIEAPEKCSECGEKVFKRLETGVGNTGDLYADRKPAEKEESKPDPWGYENIDPTMGDWLGNNQDYDRLDTGYDSPGRELKQDSPDCDVGPGMIGEAIRGKTLVLIPGFWDLWLELKPSKDTSILWDVNDWQGVTRVPKHIPGTVPLIVGFTQYVFNQTTIVKGSAVSSELPNLLWTLVAARKY